jgi:hypothetical protein
MVVVDCSQTTIYYHKVMSIRPCRAHPTRAGARGRIDAAKTESL